MLHWKKFTHSFFFHLNKGELHTHKTFGSAFHCKMSTINPPRITFCFLWSCIQNHPMP